MRGTVIDAWLLLQGSFVIRRYAVLARQIGYASGNFGKNVIWTTFDTFALYYFVEFIHLPPTLAGAIVATTMMADAALDVTIGLHADRSGRTDRIERHLLAAGPLCAVAFILFFAMPALPGQWAAIAAPIAFVIARLGYAIGDVAHNTLLVRIASTTRDAARVSGYRLLFSAAGVATVGYGISTVYAAPVAHRGSVLFLTAMTGGLIYAATLGIAFIATNSPWRRPRRKSTDDDAARPVRRSKFLLFLAIAAAQSALAPLLTRALPFFASSVHGDPAWAGNALRIMAVTQATGLLFCIAAAHRISPRTMLIAGHGLNVMAMTLLMVDATREGNVAIAVLGIGAASMNMALWALLPEIAGTHHRVSAAIGVFLMVLKSGAALGTTILTISLGVPVETDWLGFEPVVLTAVAGAGLGSLICIGTALWLPDPSRQPTDR